MMKKKYSTRRLEAIKTTAVASQYIAHIENLDPGPVVLYVRVSRRHQDCHLEDQQADLTRKSERRGHDVIGLFKETASGWADYRTMLQLAVLEADRAGAVVVAESVDRFIRHPEFNPKTNPEVLPTVFDFERLMADAANVKLATLHHSDTPWKVVRGFQSKRGQAGSGHRGGRPIRGGPGSKKRRRESKMPEALKHREAGMSYRKIGQQLNVAWSTIRDWIKRDNGSLRAEKPHTFLQSVVHQ